MKSMWNPKAPHSQEFLGPNGAYIKRIYKYTERAGGKDRTQNVNGSCKWKWNYENSLPSSLYFSILFESFALSLYHFSCPPPKGVLFHKEKKKKNPTDLYFFPHLILLI